MNQSTLQPLLVALLFLSSLLTSTAIERQKHRERSLFGAPKTTVSILNALPEDLDLTVHCKSGDDDLGEKILQFNGTYEWSFHVNFGVTTLFFCSFSWRNAAGSFEIYKAKRDMNWRCPTYCSWAARDDGVYGYKESDHVNDIHFPWP
ncbi:Self-incompatibility protein [Trema orientale]|uniref:S-protein homolog n=1 Tax=Trema orientale TaxID=63057 RepID=A0A2P5G013_TREOI|nr:Self-incompatibility protein [Trema orientale]